VENLGGGGTQGQSGLQLFWVNEVELLVEEGCIENVTKAPYTVSGTIKDAHQKLSLVRSPNIWEARRRGSTLLPKNHQDGGNAGNSAGKATIDPKEVDWFVYDRRCERPGNSLKWSGEKMERQSRNRIKLLVERGLVKERDSQCAHPQP